MTFSQHPFEGPGTCPICDAPPKMCTHHPWTTKRPIMWKSDADAYDAGEAARVARERKPMPEDLIERPEPLLPEP